MNESLRFLGRPLWVMLIVFSVLSAAGAGLWLGLQQDTKQSATTYIFASRVGRLDRPLTTLEDHVDDLINAVEFPTVFEAVLERSLLGKNDFEFTIELVEETQSVVEVVVVSDRAGDAERVARILSEEVVRFVLDGLRESIVAEIGSVESSIASLEDEQTRLRGLALGAPPPLARDHIETQLLSLDATSPPGLADELRLQLAEVRPVATSYLRNSFELGKLYQSRARASVERSDLTASILGVNDEWYRSVSPVVPASNVPIAIAMAFAAAAPAALVAIALAALNLNLRTTGQLLPARNSDQLLM